MKQRFLVSSSSTTNLPPVEDKNYVGLDLLQEQTRLKALRRGYVFNLMLAGRSGLGKSTLVNTLFKSEVCRKKSEELDKIPSTTEIHSTTCDLNEKGIRLKLRITDTPGFGDQINNENCWEPLVKYIEDQYSTYLEEEQKIDRQAVIPDTRVHCCLYFIQPSGHALSSLDIEVLKRLTNIVCVVPVIAKSDTLTIEERLFFKERIRADLLDHQITFYPLDDSIDGEEVEENANLRDLIPFAVVGSTIYHDYHGRKILGRKTKWGLVDVENRSHSDFPVLRDMLIRTHLTDLIEVTAGRYYQEFRKGRLLSQNEVDMGKSKTNKPTEYKGNSNAKIIAEE